MCAATSEQIPSKKSRVEYSIRPRPRIASVTLPEDFPAPLTSWGNKLDSGLQVINKAMTNSMNSCWIDSVIFATYAFDSTFDYTLADDPNSTHDVSVQRAYLRDNIVAPLRRCDTAINGSYAIHQWRALESWTVYDPRNRGNVLSADMKRVKFPALYGYPEFQSAELLLRSLLSEWRFRPWCEWLDEGVGVENDNPYYIVYNSDEESDNPRVDITEILWQTLIPPLAVVINVDGHGLAVKNYPVYPRTTVRVIGGAGNFKLSAVVCGNGSHYWSYAFVNILDQRLTTCFKFNSILQPTISRVSNDEVAILMAFLAGSPVGNVSKSSDSVITDIMWHSVLLFYVPI
jgi:hypothetical protein